ncbi:MAG: hypothetical protein ACTSVV_08290, partial [Promethearchaeota archaeon]
VVFYGLFFKSIWGFIQLPCIYFLFIKKKTHNRPFLKKNRKIRGKKRYINEIEIFMNCKCPACKTYNPNGNWKIENWKKKQRDFDQYTEESRLLRVIHNLWVYQNELNLMKKAIKNKRTFQFVENRLQNSVYRNLIEIVKNKSTKSLSLLDFFKNTNKKDCK